MSEPILIFWTCKDQKEAKHIVKLLLEKRVIACASLIDSVYSFFHWKGEIQESIECKVFLKTQKAHFQKILEVILEKSSYDIPEVLQIPIEKGNPAYLEWIEKETKIRAID